MSHLGIINRQFLAVAAATVLTACVGNALCGRVSSAQKTRSVIGTRIIDSVLQTGHSDYSHYTTPEMCLEAVGRVQLNATRVITKPAVGIYDPANDPLVDSTIVAAKQCARQFTATSVPPLQLLEYMELSLVAGNDADAMTAMNRWRETMPTDSANRAWALLTLIDIVDKVPPVRIPVVEKLTVELNALGVPAAIQRMKAESWWIQRSWARWDTTAIKEHSYAYLKAYGQMTPQDNRRWLQFLTNAPGSSWGTYMAREYQTVGDMQGSIMLARLKSTSAPEEIAGLQTHIKEQTGASISDAEWKLMTVYGLLSLPVAMQPIPATTWFGTQGAHEWPSRGRVSMYYDITGYTATDAAPNDFYEILRHVHQQFGDTVNMTLVYKTQGFFRNSQPMKLTEEVEAVRKYFLDDLKLPVNLAIIQTVFDTLPDGRLAARPAAWDVLETYNGPRLFPMFFSFGIADAKGMSVWRSPSWAARSPEMDAYIARGIRQSAGALH